MRLIPIFFACLLAASSCKPQKQTTSSTTQVPMPIPMTIENTRWVLAGMRGVAAQPESYMKGAPELTFGESPSLSGSTGCNSFNGSYILKGADLRLTPGAMTKMKCPGTGENDFLAALAQVTAYRIDGGMLVMLNQAGEEIMIFTLWRE